MSVISALVNEAFKAIRACDVEWPDLKPNGPGRISLSIRLLSHKYSNCKLIGLGI